MFRIDNSTAAPALAAPAAVGAPGYFTGGDPATATPPTILDPDFMNMLQEELIAVIAAAGIAPVKSNRAQVAAAIAALISNAISSLDLTAQLAAKANRLTTISATGLASGGGDLSAPRTINVPAASDADAIAGTATNSAVTPRAAAALVANRIAALVNSSPAALDTLKELADALGDDPNFATTVNAALAARIQTVNGKGGANVILVPADLGAAPATRVIGVAGLATGGGDFSADRTITVPKASAAEAAAGTDDAKALTPLALAGGAYLRVVASSLIENGGYRVLSDGLKECWGFVDVPANTAVTVGLPVAHTSFVVPVGGGMAGEIVDADENTAVTSIVGTPPTGFRVMNAYNSAVTFRWHTKGV